MPVPRRGKNLILAQRRQARQENPFLGPFGAPRSGSSRAFPLAPFASWREERVFGLSTPRRGKTSLFSRRDAKTAKETIFSPLRGAARRPIKGFPLCALCVLARGDGFWFACPSDREKPLYSRAGTPSSQRTPLFGPFGAPQGGSSGVSLCALSVLALDIIYAFSSWHACAGPLKALRRADLRHVLGRLRLGV